MMFFAGFLRDIDGFEDERFVARGQLVTDIVSVRNNC